MKRYSASLVNKKFVESAFFIDQGMWMMDGAAAQLEADTPEHLVEMIAEHFKVTIKIVQPKDNECGAV